MAIAVTSDIESQRGWVRGGANEQSPVVRKNRWKGGNVSGHAFRRAGRFATSRL